MWNIWINATKINKLLCSSSSYDESQKRLFGGRESENQKKKSVRRIQNNKHEQSNKL